MISVLNFKYYFNIRERFAPQKNKWNTSDTAVFLQVVLHSALAAKQTLFTY